MGPFCTIVIIISVFTLDLRFKRVLTITMLVNTRSVRTVTSECPGPVIGERRAAFSSMLWVDRGVMVGVTLGAAAGSILPFFGTIVGGCIGLVAGVVIGVAVAAFAAVSRKWFPASPEVTSFRERLCCIGVIWALVALLEARAGLGLVSVVPAFLGTLHASFAGPPEPDAVYCGKSSPLVTAFCRRLPVAIVAVILTRWILALLTVGIR